MSNTMEKAYNANKYEDDIYTTWEESGFFNPDNLPGDRKEPFCIMMPPPNVTGVLHLGHALENSLMDVELRYQRMRGKKALLVPGTDHAAVATQARVEDNEKKKGIDNPRQHYGREKLLEIIRDYAEECKGTILSQVRKMGTSCDWSRLAYTFDEERSAAVNEMFRLMYDDGLIYRGYRVVNWSVKGQSTCSEDELVYVDQQTTVYTFKYSKDFPIEIATTRPETKLGDTAVAVHPDDKRYKEYVGKQYTVDIGAETPLAITIIADDTVDPEYGTGAVGVTPAHSQADFEMYQKKPEIGLIKVIGEDGLMTSAAGKEYEGLTTIEAREKLVAWLEKQGLITNNEEITHSVGTSDRFGDVVEALPMDQWFVDVNKEIPGRGKSLKELMRDAVTTGHKQDKERQVIIIPERFHKTYLHWIDNLRDWCISRQIWWGHRIPVWYNGDDIQVGTESPGKDWQQDEDTLDTWFSSGMWTFSTLGWPEQSDDLRTYHSTSWMQMGYEIIFLWLARMILMSTYALDDIPFHNVYVHGILRDKEGKKFSKSAGNGIDPIEICKKYGTDALRLSLLKGIAPGNDARFYEEKVEDARNFVNKLWNISRYVLSQEPTDDTQELTLADQWILSRVNQVTQEVTNDFEQYQFSQAAERLYDFVWHEFADWYIEASKIQPNNTVARQVLESVVILTHPYIPFVTEVLWKQMGKESLLIVQEWPTAETSKIQPEIEKQFSTIQELITSIRNIRREYRIEPGKQLEVVDPGMEESHTALIQHLARVEFVKEKEFTHSATVVTGEVKLVLPLDGVINVEKEKQRIEKEIKHISQYIAQVEKKLKNKKFTENAPEQVIQQTEESKKEREAERDALQQSLEALE